MEKPEVKERGKVDEKGNEGNVEYYMGLPYSILLHQIEDDGEKYWIAEVPELPGCKSHGSTVDEAVKSAEEAKRDWILDSLEKGELVPTPVERDRFNGRILVRTSRSLHRALSLMSDIEKLSLNQLIVTILAKEVGRLEVLNRVEDKLDKVLDRLTFVPESKSVTVQIAQGFLDQVPIQFKSGLGQALVDDAVCLNAAGAIHTYLANGMYCDLLDPIKLQSSMVGSWGRARTYIAFQEDIQSPNIKMAELVIDQGGLR